MVSCVNGFLTNSTVLTDEMFEDATMHNPAGEWQMIFGVLTRPDYRGHGYAQELLCQVIHETEKAGRRGLILTCKRGLIPFIQASASSLKGNPRRSTVAQPGIRCDAASCAHERRQGIRNFAPRRVR